MLSPMQRRLLRWRALAAVFSFAAACEVPAERPPEAPAVTATAPEPSAEPKGPGPSREEALSRGMALAARWNKAPHFERGPLAAWLRDERLEEAEILRVLGALAGPCLEEQRGGGPACLALDARATDLGSATWALAELLAELADEAPGERPATKLLVRLAARGYTGAHGSITRLLMRRMTSRLGPCAPPGEAEIRAARDALADFAVIEAAPRAQGGALAARKPAPRELDDLAYFMASVAGGGPEVGAAAEDWAAPQLPEGHPDRVSRAALREAMKRALLDGDVAGHARAGEAILRSLGYPDRVRMTEDGPDAGHGAISSLMRDLARSLEILGRLEQSEALYRRAATLLPVDRRDQIAGVIRSVEPRLGCRGVVAERLFAAELDVYEVYGPERLAASGFDVARVYAGALPTLGRDEPASVERALRSEPALAAAAERFARLGPEAWAKRVRAVAGYADTARGAGFDRLVALTERVPAPALVDVLGVIGVLAEDVGPDPCLPSDGSSGSRAGNRERRTVHPVMRRCETRIGKDRITRAVNQIASLSGHADWTVREAVAVALGDLGSPLGLGALQRLASDPFDAGGQVCRGSAPQVCEPNHPVARAGREARDAVRELDKLRAKQRAQAR
jgi:hypothetical protein